jgi:hypothetical protein
MAGERLDVIVKIGDGRRQSPNVPGGPVAIDFPLGGHHHVVDGHVDFVLVEVPVRATHIRKEGQLVATPAQSVRCVVEVVLTLVQSVVHDPGGGVVGRFPGRKADQFHDVIRPECTKGPAQMASSFEVDDLAGAPRR